MRHNQANDNPPTEGKAQPQKCVRQTTCLKCSACT